MFPKRFSLYCLFGVIKQKRKTLVEYENCPPLLCIMLLFSLCLLLSHFSSFLSSLSFLYNPYPPPSLTSSLSPLFFSPPSHLLLSILLTFPSALRSHRSDPFHRPDPIICVFMTFIILALTRGFMTGLLTTSILYIPAHTHTHTLSTSTHAANNTRTQARRDLRSMYMKI